MRSFTLLALSLGLLPSCSTSTPSQATSSPATSGGPRVADCVAAHARHVPSTAQRRCFARRPATGAPLVVMLEPTPGPAMAAVDATTLVFRAEVEPRPSHGHPDSPVTTAWRATTEGWLSLTWSNGFRGGALCLRDDGDAWRGELVVDHDRGVDVAFVEVDCAGVAVP